MEFINTANGRIITNQTTAAPVLHEYSYGKSSHDNLLFGSIHKNVLGRLKEAGEIGTVTLEIWGCISAGVLHVFREASAFIRIDSEMCRLLAYFDSHAWSWEMMRNCPLFEKILGPILTLLNIFRDPLLVTQRFETSPHPTPTPQPSVY